jgi:hypothetical protein
MLTSSLLFSISFVLLTLNLIQSLLPIDDLSSSSHIQKRVADDNSLRQTALLVAVLDDDHRGSGR